MKKLENEEFDYTFTCYPDVELEEVYLYPEDFFS